MNVCQWGCRQGNEVWLWQWGGRKHWGECSCWRHQRWGQTTIHPKKKEICTCLPHSSMLDLPWPHRHLIPRLKRSFNDIKSLRFYHSLMNHWVGGSLRHASIHISRSWSKGPTVCAGDIISVQRCALTSEHVDQLLFFKKSMPWYVQVNIKCYFFVKL